MKKRLISTTLAAILAVSSLSMSAFADDPTEITELDNGTATTNVAENGSLTTTVASSTTVPDYKVTLPATVKYVANPYKLQVTIPDRNDPEKTMKTQDTVISPDIIVKNNGIGKIAITAKVKATASGVTLLDATTKVATTTGAAATDKTIRLWLEPATPKTTVDKTTKESTTTYSYTGKYNAKTCELAVATPGDTNGLNQLLTLGPVGSKDVEVEYTKVGATDVTLENYKKAAGSSSGTAWDAVDYLSDVDGYVADGTNATAATDFYYLENKDSDALTTALTAVGDANDAIDNWNSKTAAQQNDTLKNSTQELIDTAKAAVAAVLTTKDKGTKTVAVPTEGHLKISGELNSNAVWAATDKAEVEISWQIKRLVNDIVK